MPEHPSAQELAAFLAAGCSARAERSRIVRHLLAGCGTCLSRLEALDPKGQLPRPLRAQGSETPLTPNAELDYERAFAAAERTLGFFLADGKPLAGPPGALLAELGLPGAAASDRANRLAIPFLTRWLIEKSHSLRYTDPREMLHWALMGRLAAEGCSAVATGSEAKRADLRADAEAQLSSSLRVLGRIEDAESCMRTAWRELERGTGDAEVRAMVFSQTTSLLTLQKEFQLAIDLSAAAASTYLELGMKNRSAIAKVTGATALLYSGDPERASRILMGTLHEIDSEEDPTLALVVRNNLARCYLDLGEPAKALTIHRGGQEIRQDLEPLILLRRDWQEGLLLHSLGEGTAATRTLGRVRRGYVERRLAREAIVVTRDLVRTLAEIGEGERASSLLEETAEWMRGMSFGPETWQFFDELRAAG